MKSSLFVILMLCSANLIYAQEIPRKRVGEIKKVTGRAYLKEPDGGPQRELTARDKDIPLFTGQELGCIEKGKCKVEFSIGRRPLETQSRYPIPNAIRSKEHPRDRVRVGENTRSKGTILLSPVDEEIGLVSPKSFRFRWRLLRTQGKLINVSPLTLSLRSCKTNELIWSEPDIDYGRGSYVAGDVRDRLKARQQQGSATSVEVIMTSESLPKERFCFSIISATEEQQLQSELVEWDAYADLIRHMERAYIFERHKLYDEAADEYEMALKLSPETDYLLAETIMVHYTLGDEDRVKVLLARLKRLPKGRGLYNEILELTGKGTKR